MSTKDHIFGEADFQKQQEEMSEWCKTHPDPRHKYVAHFTFMDEPRTEEVWEMNADLAEEHVRNEWAKVGVILYDLQIKEN